MNKQLQKLQKLCDAVMSICSKYIHYLLLFEKCFLNPQCPSSITRKREWEAPQARAVGVCQEHVYVTLFTCLGLVVLLCFCGT